MENATVPPDLSRLLSPRGIAVVGASSDMVGRARFMARRLRYSEIATLVAMVWIQAPTRALPSKLRSRRCSRLFIRI